MTKDKLYLKPNRLEDVITLISLLATAQTTYRTLEGIDDALHAKPKSAENWKKIALDHSEFFKPNEKGTHIALLIRSFFEAEIREEKEFRKPLEVAETQKLIDQAISLHDKQLARYQRNNFKIPLYASLVAASASLIIGFSSILSNNNVTQKLNQITDSVTSIKQILLQTKVAVDTVRQNLPVVKEMNIKSDSIKSKKATP